MPGWRTVIINEKSSLIVEDAQLIAAGRQKVSFPLEQLRQILITSPGTALDADTLNAVSAEHIRLTLCDRKYQPACEVIPIGRHHEAAGSVMDQAEWKQDRKDEIWRYIVETKLNNQLRLMLEKQKTPPPQFREYCASVQPGDSTNREAVAARLYFTSLFGHDFRRHAKDLINAKLNYGYTILCSAFSRILASHGYHTGLGIHHCSRDNPVNLSCDLMEPFRPLADRLAFDSGEAELDWTLRKQLIALPYMTCHLDGDTTTVDEAIEVYTLAVLKAVKTGRIDIPEVIF